MIFDLEMQRKFHPGYPIMSRAMYYTGRLFSSQEVNKSEYNKLKPVRSSWICLNGVPSYLQNKVLSFKFEPHCDTDKDNPVYSKAFPETSLMCIDLILLSKRYALNSSDSDIVRFLQSVFKNKFDSEWYLMSEIVDDNLRGLIEGMTRASSALEEDIMLGIAEGRAEGMVAVLRPYISSRRDNGMSKEDITEDLMTSFGFDRKVATRFVEECQ